MKIGKLLIALLALLLVIPNSAGAQTCGLDDYESDQNLLEAKTLIPNEAQSRTFHIDGDRDWLVLNNLEAGKFYIVETFDLAVKTDTFLRVFSPIGNMVGADDDIDEVLCSYYDDAGVHFVDEQYCASRVLFRAAETGFYQTVVDSLYFDPLYCHEYSIRLKPAYIMYFPTMHFDYKTFPPR